jgi:hypothetical protein
VGLLLGSEGAQEFVLLFEGLEAAVTELGGGVDELNFELLGHPVAGGGEDRLTQNDRSLADANDSTLDEEEVLVDNTVVRETTNGGDVLLNGIGSGSGVVCDTSDGTSTNSVDLLVDLGTAVIAELTTTGDCPLDSSGVPSTDTGDLTETSVGLTRKSVDAESLDDTLGSLTLGDANSVDALVISEDLTDGDLLFELGESPVDLLGNSSTVNLDFHDVGLNLAEVELADLGSAEDTDCCAVLLDALEVSLDGGLALVVLLEAVGVLGEGLLLGVHPVLVEAALDVVVELGSPDGGEGAHTAGSLNVTDHTDNLHWGALNDGAGVNDILLDNLLTFTTLEVLDNVGHAGLVAHKGGKVDGLGSIVSGEMSDATVVMSCAALGKVSEGALSGRFKLAVRHSFMFINNYRST